MIARALGLAAAFALVSAAATSAEWRGNSQHAAQLIAANYSQRGVPSPRVADTGRTFEAGGVTWRLYTVTWPNGGFRHVAVHRNARGQYLAIEGLEKDRKKWSQAVQLGR